MKTAMATNVCISSHAIGQISCQAVYQQFPNILVQWSAFFVKMGFGFRPSSRRSGVVVYIYAFPLNGEYLVLFFDYIKLVNGRGRMGFDIAYNNFLEIYSLRED